METDHVLVVDLMFSRHAYKYYFLCVDSFITSSLCTNFAIFAMLASVPFMEQLPFITITIYNYYSIIVKALKN